MLQINKSNQNCSSSSNCIVYFFSLNIFKWNFILFLFEFGWIWIAVTIRTRKWHAPKCIAQKKALTPPPLPRLHLCSYYQFRFWVFNKLGRSGLLDKPQLSYTRLYILKFMTKGLINKSWSVRILITNLLYCNN